MSSCSIRERRKWTEYTKAGFDPYEQKVLGVTAMGEDLKAAIDKAYVNVRKISFDGQQVRSDIGAKGLRHLT